MEELKAILINLTPEQIGKIKDCKTAQEILDVAKAEALAVTPEQAEIVLKLITPPYGLLSDEEIEKVAGGSFTIAGTQMFY